MTLPLTTRNFDKILLIKLSAVGDVVHTIPVLNKLRRRFPQAQLDWLTTPAMAELLRHHPAITNIVEFARQEWSAPWRLKPFSSSLKLAAELRAVGYDLVIDMHGQFRTAVLAFATGAPVRIGFDRPRAEVWQASPRVLPEAARRHAWKGAREGSWLAYTHHMAVPTLDRHAVDRYLNVGPILGLDEDAADFWFPIPESANERIENILRKNGIADSALLFMAPGTQWETKRWQSEKFAEVARHFIRRGYVVVLAGSSREQPDCAAVAKLAPGAIDLAGQTTLTELTALIERSVICITNDSGPMHLAVARNRPVVSIFGSTDPIWIGPYGRYDAVLKADLPCSPCYFRALSRCSHGHACMHEISANAVIERAERVLSRKAAIPDAAKV